MGILGPIVCALNLMKWFLMLESCEFSRLTRWNKSHYQESGKKYYEHITEFHLVYVPKCNVHLEMKKYIWKQRSNYEINKAWIM